MFEHAPRGKAAALGRHAVARALEETGETMVEVMVAALLIALMAAAIFTGLGSVADIAGGQRHQAEASELAQQDEQRLRGLNVTELASSTGATGATAAALYGNASYNQTVDGETYTVASTAQFVTASTTSASCTSSASSNADYIETTSKVTWQNSNDHRAAVEEHSLITPHVGGGMVIQVTDGAQPTANPVSGVQIQVTSTNTAMQSLTTDANGCVVFAGLPGGTYTVSWPGYVSESGASSASVILADGTTVDESYQLQVSGSIQASFTTSYAGDTGPTGVTGPTGTATVTGTADTFVASNSQVSPAVVSGTPDSYSTTVTGSSLYPLSGTNDAYSVYAGDCTADAPPSPTSAVVTAAGTTPVTIAEPAMIIDVWGATGELDDRDPSLNYVGAGWTQSGTYNGSDTSSSGNYNYDNTETYSSNTGDYMKVTFMGTSVEWIGSKAASHGSAYVTLDNNAPVTVSAYAATATHQTVLYNSGTLTNGIHTLKIAVAGINGGGGADTISIDAIELNGGYTLLSTAPNVVLTDTGCGNYTTDPPTQVQTVAQGALTNPAEPYGTFNVCADNGSVMNTASVSNTNFTSGNKVNIYLSTGATGLTSGTCPG
jgi:hypothetical protein